MHAVIVVIIGVALPFQDGATTGKSYNDFDTSYDPVNGLNFEHTASTYTVQDGDTLSSIAQAVWGDASYWYMIADANGLSSDSDLVSGMDLVIPDKIHNDHNSSSTTQVYDPNEAIGDVSPTAPHKGWRISVAGTERAVPSPFLRAAAAARSAGAGRGGAFALRFVFHFAGWRLSLSRRAIIVPGFSLCRDHAHSNTFARA